MDYKEAIERIKARFNKWALDDEDLDAIKTLVPELKEDEDEKIRMGLINYFKERDSYRDDDETFYGMEYSDIVSYLEKQKERKAIEDVIKNITKNKEAATKFLKSAGIMDENGELAEMYRSEQKPEEKLSKEEYVKKFKALCDAYEIKLPNREYDIYGLCGDLRKLFGDIQKPTEWSEDNIKELTEFEAAMLHIGMSFFGGFAGLNPNNTNEVKEQAKLLLQLVPKQEWSEEDEINRQIAIGKFEGTEVALEWDIEQRVIKWLKSLRPQPNWKPSDEQLRPLGYAIDYFKKKGNDTTYLESLLNDLNKL